MDKHILSITDRSINFAISCDIIITKRRVFIIKNINLNKSLRYFIINVKRIRIGNKVG